MSEEDFSGLPVERYFSGLTENTFHTHLGVVDPPLIEYLSRLLVSFVRNDVVHRIRGISGRPLMSVPEMVAEASARLGDAKRELHQHIGDFTLFWAGVYPEALRRSEDESGQFESYRNYGIRSYKIASSICSSQDDAVSSSTLENLSDRYDLCCYGLREIRRQWESDDSDGPLLLG
jgi:hypothetical protein